ncbi:PAS domain-containing sensor histidine kinase [Tellurirhabdus rosea]|uniref:PAS domain-containing sensor histidine kinase n=1 Tax=Tellurirhabdus rosea TaxID=2674997 RepID=UPI002255B141|nr:PAS domain-containing protein [Tellurirhabdus rosea]
MVSLNLLNAFSEGLLHLQPCYQGGSLVDFQVQVINEAASRWVQPEQHLTGNTSDGTLRNLLSTWGQDRLWDRISACYFSGESAREICYIPHLNEEMRLEIKPFGQEMVLLISVNDQPAVPPKTPETALLQQLPSPVAVMKGEEFILELANDRLLEVWGKKAGDVVGRPYFEAFAPAAVDQLKEDLRKVYRTGQPFIRPEVPVTYLRDGKTVEEIHRITHSPIVNSKGEIEGIMAASYDISVEVAARKREEESQAFIRAALESNPDCVKVLDREGRLHYMNHNGLCVMEIPDFCQIEGRPWWTLWPAESQPIVKAALDQALNGSRAQFQAYCPTAQGTAKWWDVVVSPVIQEDGSIEQVISASRDITDQRKGEEAIRRRNKQLDLLSRTSHSLIVTHQNENDLLQTIFKDICQTFELEMFFNFEADEKARLLRLNTWGGLTAEEADHFDTIRFGDYLCGQVAERRALLVAENLGENLLPGSEKLHQTGVKAYAGFPIQAGQRLVGTIGFATRQRTHFAADEIQTIRSACDLIAITLEQTRLARAVQESEVRYRTLAGTLESLVAERTGELERKNQELIRSNEHLQQFAYVASHDLQEPLRKITSFGDMLATQYGDHLGTTGLDLLGRMQAAARRMSQLVQDLLTYSRLSQRQTPVGVVSVQTVLEGVLQDQELRIRESNARIDVGPMPEVMGDGIQLQQLFTNLISNALKYMQEGVAPHIRIAFSRVAAHELPDQWRESVPAGAPAAGREAPTEFYRISVSDNGIGFEESYLDRIFRMFQRLHNWVQFEGSGMGLAICKRVIDNHHGYITAHSRPGEGSTFLVYLPALPDMTNTGRVEEAALQTELAA